VQAAGEVGDKKDRPDRTQQGAELLGGISTPEMNQSGMVAAWTSGCAASAEPISPATA
jgi:hypothetical protein